MLISEMEFDLKPNQKAFLDYVNSNSFPLYLDEATPGYTFFGHVLRRRIDDPFNYGSINSDDNLVQVAESFLYDICKNNNIDINIIYRTAINCITYESEDYGDIHVDHPYDHKVFIYYINSCTRGSTYIFDKEKNITKVVEHKINKGFIFNNSFHAAGFPGKREVRKVLVSTFN